MKTEIKNLNDFLFKNSIKNYTQTILSLLNMTIFVII